MFLRAIGCLCWALLVCTSLEASPPLLAEKIEFYYGAELSSRLQGDLKNRLHDVLDQVHISQQNSFDRLAKTCSGQHNRCYSHRNLGYSNARKYLFGFLHLQEDRPNEYYVVSSYCQKIISNDNFPKGKGLGPMKIPSANILNTEHSWPQSRFTGQFSKSMQKSDLHALYPVQMEVNSMRGNYPYGKVQKIKKQPCSDAVLGTNAKGQIVFEPSYEVKGNIARSLFYFSTRYKIKIKPQEEIRLRRWHELDPIDQNEIIRNEEIFEIQHVRNPFIDHPEWVDQIPDF